MSNTKLNGLIQLKRAKSMNEIEYFRLLAKSRHDKHLPICITVYFDNAGKDLGMFDDRDEKFPRGLRDITEQFKIDPQMFGHAVFNWVVSCLADPAVNND
jgi:hypothetical protein